ncbi:MAG: hypothetical protein CR971_02445 [candidate division SR1 bacterium]|nr:MAG: hypothetical protein CR971_02445 [candidate division SR1 bacterium]
MQKYELVLVMDPKLNETERNGVIEVFEKDFKDNILKKDDMGVQQLKYDLSRVKGRDAAYFISYHLELEPTAVKKVKEIFLYTSEVYRNFLYKMGNEELFWEYDKINKELQKIIDAWDVKRYGNRVSFFANKDNDKYLTWKAITMLKKYLTRFGNVKPRAYTGNSVSKQKTVRKMLIRARELGLLDYIR